MVNNVQMQKWIPCSVHKQWLLSSHWCGSCCYCFSQMLLLPICGSTLVMNLHERYNFVCISCIDLPIPWSYVYKSAFCNCIRTKSILKDILPEQLNVMIFNPRSAVNSETMCCFVLRYSCLKFSMRNYGFVWLLALNELFIHVGLKGSVLLISHFFSMNVYTGTM